MMSLSSIKHCTHNHARARASRTQVYPDVVTGFRSDLYLIFFFPLDSNCYSRVRSLISQFASSQATGLSHCLGVFTTLPFKPVTETLYSKSSPPLGKRSRWAGEQHIKSNAPEDARDWAVLAASRPYLKRWLAVQKRVKWKKKSPWRTRVVMWPISDKYTGAVVMH